MFAQILTCALVAQGATTTDEAPYTAYVIVEGAEIVAGPGHRHYATGRLSRGTEVQVYREEPSGWLAIRPPEGEFSWTPAEFIERLSDDTDLGRVKEPVGAWIGTAVEHASEHRQEVTLKAGELVRILGEKTITNQAGRQSAWLKIAPPAGEFRWIHLRDVSRQQPVDPPRLTVSSDSAADTEDAAATAAEIAPVVTAAPRAEPNRIELPGQPIAIRELAPVAHRGSGVSLAQYQRPANSVRPSLSPDGFVPRKRRPGDDSPATAPPSRPPAAIAPRQLPEPAARTATIAQPRDLGQPLSGPAASSPGSTGRLTNDEIVRQLDQLEVELSLMLAQDRSKWNFPALKERVAALVEQGADPAARGRARLLLDKIKQFEETFHVAGGPAFGAKGIAPSAAVAADRSSAAPDPLADPRYDAQGWLKPVVSRKGDKPAAPYAVVDAEGQPLCFVSPSPGLNLNRYLNQPVGLYGRRGYLEQLGKPHVLAERVIALDTRVR